jgi:hypothetical protein
VTNDLNHETGKELYDSGDMANVTDEPFLQELQGTMALVQAPTDLRENLLRIPDQAANEGSFLRRILPVAAALLLAIGIGLYYQPVENSDFADEIFGHIYFEEPYYGEGNVLSLAEVNARMAPVLGKQINADGENFIITFAKDCFVAKQKTMHLVVKGETGPVNFMMIPSRVVEGELRFSDQRFNGLATPASGGTLVVVGNKQESITRYRDRMASSLNWKY